MRFGYLTELTYCFSACGGLPWLAIVHLFVGMVPLHLLDSAPVNGHKQRLE